MGEYYILILKLEAIYQFSIQVLCYSYVCFKCIGIKYIPYISGPQPFWHQGPVSWKAIFPRKLGEGSGGNASDEERWRAADEASLACPLLISCCAAQFLTGRRLLLVHGLGVGDPCLISYPTSSE